MWTSTDSFPEHCFSTLGTNFTVLTGLDLESFICMTTSVINIYSNDQGVCYMCSLIYFSKSKLFT